MQRSSYKSLLCHYFLELFHYTTSIDSTHMVIAKIRGTTAPESHDRLKCLLPDGSTWGFVVRRYPSTLISVFLTEFRYISFQVSTQLSSRGWVDPVPDPIFPEKFLRHSSFSNPSVALPTSHLILQPFRCFTYITARSQTFISLLLRHRLFTYVTHWLY